MFVVQWLVGGAVRLPSTVHHSSSCELLRGRAKQFWRFSFFSWKVQDATTAAPYLPRQPAHVKVSAIPRLRLYAWSGFESLGLRVFAHLLLCTMCVAKSSHTCLSSSPTTCDARQQWCHCEATICFGTCLCWVGSHKLALPML